MKLCVTKKLGNGLKKKRFSVLSVVLAAALSVLVTLGAAALLVWKSLGESGLAVAYGAAVIRAEFVEDYDEDALADAALSAMVNTLGDRWSYYMDATAYEDLELRRSNAYVGIGVTVAYEEDGLRIQSVAEGGPAEAALLQPGDLITAADGHDLTGENAAAGASYIQGEEGTQVALTVLDQSGNERQVRVTRARIQSDPVRFELLEDNVGYVALDNFYDGSAAHVEAAVEDLLGQGAVCLVFDMRDNPGGYLGEMLELLDYLLPEGVIFQSGDKNGPNQAVRSDESCVDAPMAVLVNGNTYSAAELFAAQLQESAGASIVGTATFGKGHSQQVFDLPGGRGINISTKTYYTGAGVSLIGTGVTLDVEVELTGPEDDQLQAAVDCLLE